MDVTIRKATAGDVGRLAELFDAYRVFYGQPSDPALAKDFIVERLSQAESVIFCACTPDNRCLGFAQLYPSFSSVSAKRIWILNDLFVTETARGLGIGTQLLKEIKSFGIETQSKSILVETTTNNIGAQKLYQSSGYQRVNERVFYELPNGQ